MTYIVYDTPVQFLAASGASRGTGKVWRAGPYHYVEAASDATDHDLTNGAGVKFYVPSTYARVTPEQFGALGNGSDETATMLKIGDWGRRYGGLTLDLAPNKTYSYTNPFWLASIPGPIEINGNGSSFQNIRASELGASVTFVHNECLAFPGIFDEYGTTVGSLTKEFGALVDTVAAGATTITLSTGESAVDFVAGKRAVIYGYAMQDTGFPRTTRYFEWVDVEAIDGLNITIKSPLIFSYRSDWPVMGTGTFTGPARMVSLHRANFKESTSVVFRNLHFKADPGWAEVDGGTINRNGRLVMAGTARGELYNCKSDGGMYVTMMQNFRDYGSTFAGEVEHDKFVEWCEMYGVNYNGGISQGTGCRHIYFGASSTIKSVGAVDALETFVFDRCAVETRDTGAAAAFTATFTTDYFALKNVTLKAHNNQINIRPVDTSSSTFTKSSPTQLTITKANFAGASLIYRRLHPGRVLFRQTGQPVFLITDTPRESGTDVLIDGRLLVSDFAGGGETLQTGNNKVEIDQPYTRPDGTLLEAIQSPSNALVYNIGLDSRTKQDKWVYNSSWYPQPGTGGESWAFGGGRVSIDRIVINVIRAYTGPSANALLRIRDGFLANLMAVIDLKTAGKRVLGDTNTGSAGSDTLTGRPSVPIAGMFIKTDSAVTYDDADDEPRWIIEVYGTRELDAL